jgi:chorismate mutase
MERNRAMILKVKKKGLSHDFVMHLFKAIHQESISHQEKVIVINAVYINFF